MEPASSASTGKSKFNRFKNRKSSGAGGGGKAAAETNFSGIAGTDFYLDTKSHCFICLSPIPRSDPQQFYSFQYVAHCVQLDLIKALFKDKDGTKKSVSDSSSPSPCLPKNKLEGVKKLKVKLCAECGNITEIFSVMYEQLEVLKMEMMSYLRKIQELMVKADKDGLMLELKSLIEDISLDTEGIAIVEKIRKEAMRKCSVKLGNQNPRILLQRKSNSNSKPKPKCKKKKATTTSVSASSADVIDLDSNEDFSAQFGVGSPAPPSPISIHDDDDDDVNVIEISNPEPNPKQSSTPAQKNKKVVHIKVILKSQSNNNGESSNGTGSNGNDNTKKYVCSAFGCGERFSDRNKFKTHKMHCKKRPHECKEKGCTRRFRTVKQLREHSNRHNSKNKKKKAAPPLKSPCSVPGCKVKVLKTSLAAHERRCREKYDKKMKTNSKSGKKGGTETGGDDGKEDKTVVGNENGMETTSTTTKTDDIIVKTELLNSNSSENNNEMEEEVVDDKKSMKENGVSVEGEDDSSSKEVANNNNDSELDVEDNSSAANDKPVSIKFENRDGEKGEDGESMELET